VFVVVVGVGRLSVVLCGTMSILKVWVGRIISIIVFVGCGVARLDASRF